MIASLENIKDFQEHKNFMHVYLLANASEYKDPKTGKIRGGSSHWIAVGVNKVQGKVQYIILDSANAIRKDQRDVRSLIAALNDQGIVSLKIRTSAIPSNIDTINTLMNFLEGRKSDYKNTPDDALQGIITNATNIKGVAEENGWFNDSAFKQYKAQLKKSLEQLSEILLDSEKSKKFTDPLGNIQLITDYIEKLK